MGGRAGAKSTIRLAFTSDAPGIIGTDADASRLQVREQVTSVRRILALPRLIEMVEYDQRTPEWTARPIAVPVGESPTRADSGGTIAAATREPLMVMASAEITLQANIQAPGLEVALLAALQEALEQRIAEEFLSGSISTSPNSTDGLINFAGITETEYAATAVGAVGGYWDSEDALPTRLAADRRAWVISEDLYRASRRTLIEPGANRRVIQNGQLADDAQAVRTALLPDGHAIYAEWPEVVLYRWSEVHLVVDMISQPGHVLLTAFGWWNWSTDRPTAIKHPESGLDGAIAGLSGSVIDVDTPTAEQDLNSLYQTLTKDRETCPRCDGYVARGSEHGERYHCLICGYRAYVVRGVQLTLDLPDERRRH